MATINLKTWLTSNKFTTATYDDVSGNVTINIATGITTDENVIKELILALEESAQNKRTVLNSPISEKAFADDPQFAFVSRSDEGVTPVTEVQIEYQPQFVLWLKSPDILASDAVNDND